MDFPIETNILNSSTVPKIDSSGTNLCKSIEQRFQENLQCNRELILLPSQDYWLNAYRIAYHKDVEILKEALEKCEHPNSIAINNAGVKMKLQLTENAIYIALKSNINNLTLWKNDGVININVTKKYTTEYQTNFCFFRDGRIMQSSSIRKNAYIPATLKSIASKAEENIFFFLLIQSYFEVMSETYPVCKDLLRDFYNDTYNLFVPITMNAIIDGSWASYQMIFQNNYKLGYKVPKSVNKMKLNEVYLKVKACKYVANNEIQKIMMLPFTKKLLGCNNEKELFKEYYRTLIEKPCKNEKLNQLDEWEKESILRDYIKMVIAVEKKVPLTIRSFRAIADKHNKLIYPYMRKAKVKKMAIPKDSPYRKLILPQNYTIIRTGVQLYQEGTSMHHCVYSYREHVNLGECVILHIEYKDNPYTAEIRIKGKKRPQFYCGQLYGTWNSPAPIELWDEVNNVLKNNNSMPFNSDML